MQYIYTEDTETMLKNANVIKEQVLSALEREGLLTKPAKDIAENYAIVMHKRGWLGSMWEKWFEGKDQNSFRVQMVKVV